MYKILMVFIIFGGVYNSNLSHYLVASFSFFLTIVASFFEKIKSFQITFKLIIFFCNN
jgi:hypothetical protein